MATDECLLSNTIGDTFLKEFEEIGLPVPAFKDIEFGEIDANAEHLLAIKRNTLPTFERAFVDPPIQNLTRFHAREKFLIYGQKGTGKSAVLRHLEKHAKESDFATDYILFKDNILEEADLFEGGLLSSVSEQDILKAKHYLHIIKRIIILKFLYLLMSQKGEDALEKIQESVPFLGTMIKKFRESSISDVAAYAFKTIYDAAESIDNDQAAALKNLKFPRLIKSQNDTLLKSFLSQAKKIDFKGIVFLDEIHFSFKDNESFKHDSMLVRDCILAAFHLNESFIREGIKCCVQMAVRSEFLEHPVIAQAEIQNQVHSFGEPMDWSSEKYDRRNPLWTFIYQRIKIEHPSVTFPEFFLNYVGEERIELLLEHTWSKPRDLVRFFNVAKRRFRNKANLNKGEFDTVIKEYSIEAWKEHRTALASFLNDVALGRLETFLGDNSYRNYERVPFERKSLADLLVSLKKDCDSRIEPDLVLNLLYVLGVFQMRQMSAGQLIFNSYHRANLQPKWDWEIYLHPAVAKRFS